MAARGGLGGGWGALVATALVSRHTRRCYTHARGWPSHSALLHKSRASLAGSSNATHVSRSHSSSWETFTLLVSRSGWLCGTAMLRVAVWRARPME